MHPILFKIGPLTVYTYGTFVFMGVAAAYWLSVRDAARLGLDKDKFSNLFFWTVIFAFLGARLLYIIVEWKLFIAHPFYVAFSRSGFVFYGGIIGGFIASCVIIKKYKWDFLKAADIIFLYVPLGHAFGRMGCFSYGCCYGKPTNSWIGMLFPPASPAGAAGVKVIPTQIISAFFLIIIFLLLLYVRRKKKFEGQVFISYFFLYGTFRFIIEFFRGDPRGYLWIFSTSQWISIIAIITAIILGNRICRIKK
ncbi:MAG: prolipoprotein diacylglyceryl transferase [Candidatus Omnitrophica bacterium 4484_171]|nr:MAG: prolipoprotein diacylglyceryl transferase [Candidatus Omnitrophica bacterium 4484_171]